MAKPKKSTSGNRGPEPLPVAQPAFTQIPFLLTVLGIVAIIAVVAIRNGPASNIIDRSPGAEIKSTNAPKLDVAATLPTGK